MFLPYFQQGSHEDDVSTKWWRRFAGAGNYNGGSYPDDGNPFGGFSAMTMFSSHPVNEKKISHRMFRHMYGVLNEVYLQNFLHG